MPFVKLHTSVPVPVEKRDVLLASLSRICAEKIGKPQQYVMAAIAEGPMVMSGEIGPAAYVEVKSIGGLSGDVNRQITSSVCKLLLEYLGIASVRIYVTFTDVEPGNWGWDGRTFG